ncbi:MAG: 4-hydroxybutyrate--acetyl-CoA CoA transferase [Firmicutes bacterium]|nr:4-hydroxybutyrate--acetyl-CoA CoA transferase [Bacillota bacterium]
MKIIGIEQALGLVKDNYKISCADAATEPQLFLSNLHTIAHKVNNVSVWTCLSKRSYPFLENKEYGNRFKVRSTYFSKPLRDAYELLDDVTYVPTHLRRLYIAILAGGAPDIFVGTCTPPDKNGKISLGLSCIYEREVIAAAKTVIMEINPNMPFTLGDVVMDASEVDYFIDSDLPLLEDVMPPVSEKDAAIGRYISDLIGDGDCLQIGIGSIPNAVVQNLDGKNDLGIHTELLSDGIVELAKKGVVTGKRKNIETGQMITSIILGTKDLYRYCEGNPDVLVMKCAYTNAYATMAAIDNQVSINTTLEVDLTGQCCSESIGTKQFSGTGGQADTAIGAQMAKGGKSFIALYSTANVRTGQGGERTEISKIVPVLKPGATVSLSRNDLHYLATEYGIVNVRGLGISERAKAIISVSHPKFRDELMFEAKKLGFIK